MRISPSSILAPIRSFLTHLPSIKSNEVEGAISHRAGLWVYGVKKKRAAAFKHLTDAKRILSQFGQTPILGRVDAALAELGQ
jgi:hypothetical protein